MKRLALLALLAATPAWAEPLSSFELLMWQDHSPARLEGLRRLGFTGAAAIASGGHVQEGTVERREAAGLRFYLENIATDFYSPYHRYAPSKSVTWLFDAAKARRRANPADASVFVREPGLSDPAWLASTAERLQRMVRTYGLRPLFYNLADEPGIGDLAAAWDADVSPSSLDGMRAWLQTVYPSLDALNSQWGTSFAAWPDVVPELTDAAMVRTDDNYSAWSDFKTWMDVAFARAVRAGTDAVHAADPSARSALEGAQVPGWGGYDYSRLAPAVDVMEVYDSGNALELARAFNPALVTFRTSFGTGPAEVHGVWQSVLRGTRGAILWDEDGTVVRDDGSPGPRGQEWSALARDIRAVLPVLDAARPVTDPVAVLYSHRSFHVRWMLDHRAKGAAWTNRDAEREYDDNAWRAARRQTSSRLAELGVSPRWLASQGVEGGALRDPALRVLILPHAIALSDAELSEIRAFAARGGTVLADTEPGVFDGHGKRRPVLLEGVATLPLPLRPDAEAPNPATLDALAALLRAAGAGPALGVRDTAGLAATALDVRRFQDGEGLLVSVHTVTLAPGTRRVVLTLPPGAAVRAVQAANLSVTPGAAALDLDGTAPALLRVSLPR